jgi:hypothetical protein
LDVHGCPALNLHMGYGRGKNTSRVHVMFGLHGHGTPVAPVTAPGCVVYDTQIPGDTSGDVEQYVPVMQSAPTLQLPPSLALHTEKTGSHAVPAPHV